MRIKTVKRYYCDYCKKATLTLRSMEVHEQHCTMNPNRVCRMCRLNDDIQQARTAELLAAVYGKWRAGVVRCQST